MNNPFENITILDFTHVYSGPYCTMLFADLGARVIKVERPGSGDDTRHYLPFKNNESGYFAYLNRNKESITLDLKSPEGKEIALGLMKQSDIVIENFSAGTMEKLGLSYEEARKVHPDIIYASISGFGQTGPLCHKAAYDNIAQAMSGLLRVTGYPDQPPVKVGVSIADANAGIHAAFCLMAALYYHEHTGKGQYIDISMMETTMSVLENFVIQYTLNGVVPERMGNEHSASAPFDVYVTKDDYVAVATASNRLFSRMQDAMGMDIMSDPRFAENTLRRKNYAELKPIIGAWMKEHTTADIVALFDQAGVPVAPLLRIDELVHHPQIRQRGMMETQHHPVIGDFEMPGFPAHFSEIQTPVRKAAPLLGADTDDVLAVMLGFSKEKIQELKDRDIV